jgi:hypothetical protein
MRLLASVMDSADIVKKHTYRKCKLGHAASRRWPYFSEKHFSKKKKKLIRISDFVISGRFVQRPGRRC